jgi:hypothetical protein
LNEVQQTLSARHEALYQLLLSVSGSIVQA